MTFIQDSKSNNIVTCSVRSTVYCTLQVEGVHRWLECPIEEVSYLRDYHRHIFHVKASVNVTHDDRFVEFIELKHKIQAYLRSRYWNQEWQLLHFGDRSCEMIARELISEFHLSECEVSEDGENGAVLFVQYDK